MRKQMIENAAFEFATQVRSVEDCIDATLAEIGELQTRLMRARSRFRVCARSPSATTATAPSPPATPACAPWPSMKIDRTVH